MNAYTISSSSSSTFIGAGRHLRVPSTTLPVRIEAADSLTGPNFKRVRTVNGKVGQDMLERWRFHRVHTSGGPADLQRVRTDNKKGGKAILERRKARAVVEVANPSLVSSVLKAFKKIASFAS